MSGAFDLLVNEKSIQAALMSRAMHELQHELVIPNSRGTFFMRESDLLSVTRAGLVHEYEIKVSLADYKRDASKSHMTAAGPIHRPGYFWYVTTFEIEPPQFAGWLFVDVSEKGQGMLRIRTKKDAPRLSSKKMTEAEYCTAARLLSFRMARIYERFYREDVLGYRESEKIRELQKYKRRFEEKQREETDRWWEIYRLKDELKALRQELAVAKGAA